MKRKLSILFALVLALSLMLVPASVAAQDGTCELTVEFPGMSGVKVYVHVDDGIPGEAAGGLVMSKTRDNSANFTLLKNTYDIVLKHGYGDVKHKVLDAVDCTGDTATVGGIVGTLTVEFPDLSGVKVYVRIYDGIPEQATGGRVMSKTRDDSVTFTLLTNIYDVVVDAPGTENDRIDDGVLVIALDVMSSINLNPKSKGVIPVAIFGHDAFDVEDVDVTTLDFEGASPAHDLTDPVVYAEHLKDVNGDGCIDLVSHYRTQETGIKPGDTVACLTFEIDGYAHGPLTLCDTIKIVGKK